MGEVFPFISALEVAFLFPTSTSSAEMKGVASPTKLLDKAIWNPRPVIDLAPRAVPDKSKSLYLFLGHREWKKWPLRKHQGHVSVSDLNHWCMYFGYTYVTLVYTPVN